MDCVEFFDMLDKYANLTENEKANLKSHAAKCEICRYEYEFFKSITNTVSALPNVDPPANLIENVNKKLDNLQVETDKFSAFMNNIKRNSYRYATAAACLAVGLVVGLNGKTIKENLINEKTDGVISTTSVTNDSVNDATDDLVENASDTQEEIQPMENAADNIPIVPEVKIKKNEVKQVDRLAVNPTDGPAKKTKSGKTVANKETIIEPKSVSASVPTSVPTSVPAVTSKPAVNSVADETNARNVISSDVTEVNPTAEPKKDEKDTEVYTIAREDYRIPEAEEPTEAPTEKSTGTEEYALASNEYRIAIGYYDVPTDSIKKSSEKEFSEKLIVNVNDVGTVTRYMNTLDAMNSGKGYQMSLSNFYELLMILDEDEISYRYSSGVQTGDTIIFSIVTY